MQNLAIFVTIRGFILGYATHTLVELWIPAIQVHFHKAEIFRINKCNRTNQKMIDNWGNAKTALPRHY